MVDLREGFLLDDRISFRLRQTAEVRYTWYVTLDAIGKW